MGFDDNAAFRQKEIFAMKDDSQIDSRCVVLGLRMRGGVICMGRIQNTH